MSIVKIATLILLTINYICVLGLIMFVRKRPTTTAAWIMLLVFMPVIGLFIYVFFGSGLRFRKKRRFNLKTERDALYQRFVTELVKVPEAAHPYGFTVARRMAQARLTDGIDVAKLQSMKPENISASHMAEDPYVDPYYYSIIQYLYKTDRSLFTDDNKVEIFTDGGKLFSTLFEDIKNAKQSIHILYYMIKNDATGRELVCLLADKAREGVEVRLLYDKLGSLFTSNKMFDTLKQAGGKVEIFFPFNIRFSSYLRINYRNHRKIVVIDGNIGYTGGMNIANEYRGMFSKKVPYPFRDTHIRLTGSAVIFLQERFFMDWLDTYEEALPPEAFLKYYNLNIYGESTGNTGLQIASSGPDTEQEEIKRAMLKMIAAAEKYVYIQTPYYIPDSTLAETLKIAAASGVDVRLMIPGKPDRWYVLYTTLSYVDELMREGVKVYQYNGFIHAKTIVADDKIATIGTTNLDIRSFELDFEVNAFIYDPVIAVQCRDIFIKDQQNCKSLTIEERKHRSIFHRFIEGLLRIFSPIM